MDEEGYLNLYIPETETEPVPEEEEEDILDEDDPFLDSDLPLSQLAEDQEEKPPEEESSGDAPEA